MENVDEVYGMHNARMFPLGILEVKEGSLMASCESVEIKVKGKGGHGSMPHLSIDPINAAAHLLISFN
jgi:metal-dependent amidase/aminoacylase/carboxypeptidase family protein